MYMLSETIGWLGVVLSIMVSVPQLFKSIKVKSTTGVSLQTYQLLFSMGLCFLIKAVVIKEPIFIVSNFATLFITVIMLYLFKLYPEHKNEEI